MLMDYSIILHLLIPDIFFYTVSFHIEINNSVGNRIETFKSF